MKIHFVPFPIVSGFFRSPILPLLSFAFACFPLFNIPLNQFNRNVFICEIKSKEKFFDIKVRMLHMYASILDGYFVDYLLPLPFLSTRTISSSISFFLSTFCNSFLLLFHKFMKRNKINLN
jgi:hypothetical protein